MLTFWVVLWLVEMRCQLPRNIASYTCLCNVWTSETISRGNGVVTRCSAPQILPRKPALLWMDKRWNEGKQTWLCLCLGVHCASGACSKRELEMAIPHFYLQLRLMTTLLIRCWGRGSRWCWQSHRGAPKRRKRRRWILDEGKHRSRTGWRRSKTVSAKK